jgi:hypothetical protein
MTAETVAAPVLVGAQVDIDVSISKAGVAYNGYGAELTYDNTILAFVPVGAFNVVYSGMNSMTLDAVAVDGPGGDGNVTAMGSARSSGSGTATGVAVTARYQCIAPGIATLRLFPMPGLLGGTTTLAPGGVVLETGLIAGEIVCEYQADVQVTKDGPAPYPVGVVVAGQPFDWVSTIHNAGPFPAVGVIIGDNLPEMPMDPQPPPAPVSVPMKIVNSVTMLYNGAPSMCVPGYVPLFTHPVTGIVYSNIVLCDLASVGHVQMNPSDVVVLTVNVTAPLYDAGKINANVTQAGSLITPDPDESNEPDCALLGLPPENVGCALTMVLNPNLSITKVGAPDPATAGGQITWTITVDCGLGGSPCSNAAGTAGPVVTDDVEAATQPNIVSAGPNCVINHADASGTDKILDPDVTCNVPAVMNPGDSVVETIVTDVLGPTELTSPTECDDDAGVAGNLDADGDSTPEVLNAPANVTCNPAVCNECLDKGSGVFPAPIAVLVGQTATVTVWEQIEVIDPGANPNLLHLWIASSASGAVSEAWVDSGTGTLAFSTGPHFTPGLFVISKQLEITCDAQTGPATVDLDISGIGLVNESPTSLIVQCFNQPQEVKVPDSGNLWIMRHPNCVDDDADTKVDEDPVDGVDNDGDTLIDEDVGPCNPWEGKGSLLINEVASAIADADSPNDSDTNPEGLGAYEKQIKFDHKLVNLTVEDAGFLDDTQRSVNCNLTIVTENWIMFGCVSTGSQDGPTAPGPVALSRIWVTPASDLIERIRPTKDNGVVTPLLDENCEWADKFGDPMLGMVNGGLVPVCGDATITIRMLEGDLNLDCNVDVLDEQAIAFRYGASFGLLLYDNWFDLQPLLADFDIDIKDLQFVFGRDGSTCQAPIPNQDPSPPIP